MKKYFLSIVALAGMLFATSCQESLVEPQVGGTTTFTVQVPDQMGTKAIGDASIIDRLYVAVYEDFDENGGTLPTSAIYKVNVPVSGGAATVELNLIQGHKYDIVFWAQNGTSYVDENSELLSIPMTNTFHNNENGAAFFHFERNFEPKGYAKGITLRRPFAQLNLGTTKESLKTNLGDVTLSKSTVVVSSVATSFNTVTGEGIADQITEGTYVASIAFDQTLTVAGKEYVYVSMDYLPVAVDQNQDKATVDITATIETNKGEIIHNFKSVPIKENYRTNIVGNLISSSTDFNVIVDAEFDGELPKSGKEQLQFVAANGGEVILQENVVLDEPLVITAGTKATLVPVVIDLNGHSISYTSEVAAHSAMITLNGGGLTVKDSQGTGKISYTYEGVGDYTFGWGSYTIANYGGVLVIDNGTIEMNCALNTGNGSPNVHMYCAVYQYNGSTTINGGTIKNDTYRSARLWQGDMNILGGSFIGQLWVQAVNNSAKLNITGGQFAPTGNDGSSVFVTNNAYEVSLNVTGGTFATKLGCSDFTKAGVKGSVYGGIFGQQPDANLIADGYYVKEVDSKYIVLKVGEGVNKIVTTKDQLQEAINAATGDYVIALGAHITDDGDVTVLQREGVNLVIDGMNHNYYGTINVDGNGRDTGAETLTVRNINFKTTINDRNFIYVHKRESSGFNVNAHNLYVEGCTFNGNETSVAIRVEAGAQLFNLNVENCTAENMHSFHQGILSSTATFKNVTSVCGSGINVNTSFESLYLENCEFNATKDDGYGLRVQCGKEGTITMKNSTFNAYNPIHLRAVNNPTVINFVGTQNTLVLTDASTQPSYIKIDNNESLVQINGTYNN